MAWGNRGHRGQQHNQQRGAGGYPYQFAQPHQMMPQMPQNQPRGLFGRQQMPPQMPMQAMPQMPAPMPMQAMPQMPMQSPRPGAAAPGGYHDPSVKYEPLSPEVLAMLPPEQRAMFESGQNGQGGQNPAQPSPTPAPAELPQIQQNPQIPQAPHPAQNQTQGGLAGNPAELAARLMEGMSNSIGFYESMAGAAGLNETQHSKISGIYKNRQNQAEQLGRVLGMPTTPPDSPTIAPNFKDGIKYALSQEAVLLNETLDLMEQLPDPTQSRALNTAAMRKVADIATLITIQ